MYLVTGGLIDVSIFLDSTEILDPSVGSWTYGASLPNPRQGLRAANIDDQILIFGIIILRYQIKLFLMAKILTYRGF